MRIISWIAALAGLLAVSRGVSAEEANASRAEALFREGAAALKRGDLARGCEKLAQSNQLDPAIGTLGLLALCHERQGRIATAVSEYRTVASLARSANQTERATVAATQAEQLSTQVSHLVLALGDDRSAVIVELDGRRLSWSELSAPLAVDAGPADIRVTRAGYEAHTERVEIAAAGSTTWLVIPKLKQREVAATGAAPSGDPLPSQDQAAAAARLSPSKARDSALPPITWVALGAGAVGVSIGTYLGVGALSSNHDSNAHCTNNQCDSDGVLLRQRALHQATGSTIAFAAGTAALGAALVLYLTHDRDGRGLAAELKPAARGGVVSLRGQF